MIHYPHGHFDAWLLMGIGFGLVLFVRGFKLYRKALVIADAPLIPIRSVPMGLVQIHGAAQGDGAFPSPVSGAPCYAYKVVIERLKADSHGSHWAHYRTDLNGVPFYLEDATGRILVDSRGAELDVPRHCRRRVGGLDIASMVRDAINPLTSGDDDNSGLAVNARSDDELLEYAAGAGYAGSSAFRFTEYCVLSGQEYDILGTCVENPRPKDQNDRNLVTKGQNERTYLISSKEEKQLEQSLSWKSALMAWGGASLTVACTATLLAQHGLF